MSKLYGVFFFYLVWPYFRIANCDARLDCQSHLTDESMNIDHVCAIHEHHSGAQMPEEMNSIPVDMSITDEYQSSSNVIEERGQTAVDVSCTDKHNVCNCMD